MDKLVILKIFNSRIEAEITKSYLGSFGIKSVVISDDVGEMYPPQQLVLGVKLMVGKKDFQKAKDALNKKK